MVEYEVVEACTKHCVRLRKKGCQKTTTIDICDPHTFLSMYFRSMYIYRINTFKTKKKENFNAASESEANVYKNSALSKLQAGATTERIYH